MIVAMDVDYRDDGARVAGVAFDDWSDAEPAEARVVQMGDVADYEPGAFYRRELPCLQAVLNAMDAQADALVVDGYVWLAPGHTKKGLGAYLHDATGLPVVGVAKTAFGGSGWARAVVRGTSVKPLFVTAVGLGEDEAADAVACMHGPHRVPTLLREVDRLCRDAK